MKKKLLNLNFEHNVAEESTPDTSSEAINILKNENSKLTEEVQLKDNMLKQQSIRIDQLKSLLHNSVEKEKHDEKFELKSKLSTLELQVRLLKEIFEKKQ